MTDSPTKNNPPGLQIPSDFSNAAARRIKARDLAQDLRTDMQTTEIMMKYRLTHDALRRVAQKLVDAEIMRPAELCQRFSSYEDNECFVQIRQVTRAYLEIALPVYDASDTTNWGIVRNISEKGLGVAGMLVRKEEAKILVIESEQFCDIPPIELQAVCRWTRRKGGQKHLSAGFQITEISRESLRRLRDLLEFL